MRMIDADVMSDKLNERLRCCNRGSVVEACILSVIDMLDSCPTIAPPPNDPLTLEELREMDGEPVRICDPDGSDGMWALVDLEYELCRTAKGGIAIFDTYGKTWMSYRRKPEEG